jgi:hypothetical protein
MSLSRGSFNLLSNFNTSLWQSILTDAGGKIVSDVCAVFDLIVLNADADMHLCLGLGMTSALDHVFCRSGLGTLPYSISGDHCPSSLHISTPSPLVSRHENWVIRCWLGGFLSVSDIQRLGIFNCQLHGKVFYEYSGRNCFVFFSGHLADLIAHLFLHGQVNVTMSFMLVREP